MYATYDLPQGRVPYPGEAPVGNQAEQGCVTRFSAFVGLSYDASSYELYSLYPQARTWRVGDRSVSCLLGGNDLVGTAKGSRR